MSLDPRNTGVESSQLIIRRLGTAPAERGCGYANDCPDVFELASGDFLIVGEDVSDSVTLPDDAGRSAQERAVRVPRSVLLAAFGDLRDIRDTSRDV